MDTFTANITKRSVTHAHRDGRSSLQDRYVLQFTDPVTKKRKQKFFKTRKEAEAAKHGLYTQFDSGVLSVQKRDLTVEEAAQHWLKSCEGRVAKTTLKGYTHLADAYIIGPALVGTQAQRISYTWTEKLPEGTHLTPMIGQLKVSDLTTADIRSWLQTVRPSSKK